MSELYRGPLGLKRITDPEVRRAYASFQAQRQRCRRRPAYAGVEVRYTSREFITWWLREIRKRAAWADPTVGRKDHDGHYEFGNIELQERAANTAEMRRRRPTLATEALGVPVALYEHGRLVHRAASINDAARWLNCGESNVRLALRDGYRVLRRYEVRHV